MLITSYGKYHSGRKKILLTKEKMSSSIDLKLPKRLIKQLASNRYHNSEIKGESSTFGVSSFHIF